MSQPDPLYAFEKLSEAVHALATHPERVQERLAEAAIYLIRIQPAEIQDEELRRMLVAIKDDLSFDEPKRKEGRIAATLQKTSDADASEIARRILELHDRLGRLLDL
ncbi:MAG TPA: hypothetical protein VIJ78_08640 [Pseudolabrys sp.]